MKEQDFTAPTFRLLISYAHPDDESFGSGGLIAKYVAQNVQVDYVCATNGEMGTVSEAFARHADSLVNIRLQELECARQVLGIHRVIHLNYQDSGMMGSASSKHPDSLWYQWQNCADDVVQRLVDIIRETKPQVIITFNRYGGYGHPDHIAIQRATTQAFNLAGDDSYTKSSLPPYAPQKLYYASIPAYRFFKLYLLLLRLRGKDIRKMGINKDVDYQAIADHIEPAHAVIDVGDYMDIWDRASDCHISQGQGKGSGTRGVMSLLPTRVRHWIASKYSLTRVYPQPDHNHVDENDLFVNVK